MTDSQRETSSAAIENFLDVEEAASRLTDALASLEVDVKGYRKATTDLTNVSEATVRLVTGLEEVGRKSSEALDVLVNIGGPHISKQLEVIEEKYTEVAGQIVELQRLERHNGSEIERVRASSQAAADISERNRISLDDALTRIQKLKEEMSYLRELCESNINGIKTLNDRIDITSTSQKKFIMFVGVIAAIAASASIAIAVRLFSN